MATDLSVDAPAGPARGWRRYRRTGIALIVVAVLGVVAAFVIGFGGLFADPVKSVNADGTATLQGTFEPYQCGAGSCEGYVQAGARSVFVRFPDACPVPQRGSEISVTGRAAPDLGKGSYRATDCARAV